MAPRMSCLIHGVLLLLLSGWLSPPDPALTQGRDFVDAVAGKMPLWDADAIARYERVQIATVKADIAMAQQAGEKDSFLACVDKLHDDWDALVAWDDLLKKESLI